MTSIFYRIAINSMMFIEVQAVLEDGEGTVDEFEARVRETDPLVGQIETLEMGRL